MKDKIPRIRSRKEYSYVTLSFATFPYLLALAEKEGYEFTYIIPAGTRSYDTAFEGENVWKGQEIKGLDTMCRGETSDWLRPLKLRQTIMLSPHGRGESLTVDADYVDLEDVVPQDIIAEYRKEQAERNEDKDFYYLNIDRQLIFVKAKVSPKDLQKANGVLWQMEEEIPLIEAFPETGKNAYQVLIALNHCIHEAYPENVESIRILRNPIHWMSNILGQDDKQVLGTVFYNPKLRNCDC